jgi:hypothetical protein
MKIRYVADYHQALLGRYEYLSQQYASLEAERRRNEEFVVAWQKEKEEYEKFVKSLARSIEDNSFVMVLIDGDGMIVCPASASASAPAPTPLFLRCLPLISIIVTDRSIVQRRFPPLR